MVVVPEWEQYMCCEMNKKRSRNEKINVEEKDGYLYISE